MTKSCRNCSEEFELVTFDCEFYQRAGVPEPTWCPSCRHLRRHGFINDYVFYPRSCDNCSKSFVAIYPPDCDYVVFCQSCWYAEQRDDKAQGRDYDFSRSFFEQYDELLRVAPRLGIIGQNNENCDYCESVANCKNCYLISECSNCEDCFYSYWIQKCVDCFDCNYSHACERCYQLDNCFNCNRLSYSTDCSECHDSAFLRDCAGCQDCLFCANLRRSQYCIFNKQYSKAEYLELRAQYNFGDDDTVRKMYAKFQEFLKTQPQRSLQVENIENCTGNYIRNAKNCLGVFHCYDAEDCRYGEHLWRGAKDCVDANSAGRDAELGYETTNSGIGSYNVKFSRYCWGCRETEYSDQCKQGYRLFGCANLKPGAEHCILNKQYSEDEWKALVAKIKQKMLADGEYGEFFPLSISPFGYNTTISYDAHPKSKDEVLALGWKWEDTPTGTTGKGTMAMQDVPTDIKQVPRSICDEILTCEVSGENFRILPKEFTFYTEENIPLPRLSPMERLRQRLKWRPPLRLLSRSCSSCEQEIQSAYDEDTSQIVYCNECYLEEVY